MQLLVTQKEIDDHLAQLNLTHDPRLVISRRQWFYTNKVKIFTCYGRTYQEPVEIKSIEIIYHVTELNSRYSELKTILQECIDTEKEIKKVDGVYIGDEEYTSKANSIVHRLQEEKAWFKQRKLAIKKIEAYDRSYYRYDGQE